jgi:drug/metabolite transporter (DMT)-like permease
MTNETEQNIATPFMIVMAFLVVYVVFGTTFLAIRIAVETIPAFMMTGLRLMMAGGLMMPVLVLQGGRFPSLIHWRSAVIVGGLMLVGGLGLLSYAEERIPSGLAALVVTTIPIWVALFDWLIFGGKRPTAQVLVGVALGTIGAALLFLPALDTSSGGDDQLIGMGIVLVGAITFAIGSLYSKRVPRPSDARMSTAAEMLAGGVMLMIVSVLAGEPSRLDVAAVSLRSVAALIYLALFGSIIAYTAFLWLLKTVEPAKATTNFYVNPVVAVFAGWLVLDEAVTTTMILAALVILLGVAVIQSRLPKLSFLRRRAEAESGV